MLKEKRLAKKYPIKVQSEQGNCIKCNQSVYMYFTDETKKKGICNYMISILGVMHLQDQCEL